MSTARARYYFTELEKNVKKLPEAKQNDIWAEYKLMYKEATSSLAIERGLRVLNNTVNKLLDESEKEINEKT